MIRTLDVLNDVSQGFLLSFEVNTGIISELGDEHFLLNLFQFIIHQSSYRSMLYSPDADSTIKSITKEVALQTCEMRVMLEDPEVDL